MQTPKEANHETKTMRYTFSLVSDIGIEKSCFLYRIKIPYLQFLTFLSLMNISRSSPLQMLFKIGALKNFAIFRIKKSLQYWCFPLNIAKFLRTAFSENFSGGCFCIILKVIKQLFSKVHILVMTS